MTKIFEAEKEYAAHVAASNEANNRAMTDNFRTTEILKHKKLMADLGAGLKACVNSGLDRATIIELVNRVFDDAGKD